MTKRTKTSRRKKTTNRQSGRAHTVKTARRAPQQTATSSRRTKTATPPSKSTQATIAALVQEVLLLSADVSEEIVEIVRLAAEAPLKDDEAERLFTKILTIVKGGRDRGVSTKRKAEIAKEVKHLVQKLIDQPRDRQAGAGRSAVVTTNRERATNQESAEPPRRHLALIEHSGLKPRPVSPTPWFRDAPIELQEGYVNTVDLKVWPDNQRLELQLNQFRAKNGRVPSNDELLEILQGTEKTTSRGAKVVDAFQIRPLAQNIAERGVLHPPIIDWWGTPHDGNRRIAACHYILRSSDFTPQQRERASKIRVWQAKENTTKDQFDAIVVSLNFEHDHKVPWPEYVKARQVSAYFDQMFALQTDIGDPKSELELRRRVAKQFAITVQEVTRYLRMVGWAEKFTEHHMEARNRDPAEVEARTDEIFQWFYEIDAGRGNAKLSPKLLTDEPLKEIVFDLMYNKLRIGAQVRDLHKILANDDALEYLKQAHAEPDTETARDLIEHAMGVARSQNIALKRIGFVDWLRALVKRLDGAAPSMWHGVDVSLLRDLRRVLGAAQGAVTAEIEAQTDVAT